ncbi:carboxyl-terminal processing protease [Bacilli bacterium PM5-9]|nr:carboxyl-terminal processing protease [Bacilli bacterium PM5-9]
MKKNQKILLAIVIFIVYSFGLYKFASNPTSIISTKTNDEHLARFIENYNVLKENWYYFSNGKEVIDAATNAMTESSKNDKYTGYIHAENSKEYFESMESEYIGLGIQYIVAGEYPLISKVFNDSPAASVNMKAGDTITSVDGKSLKNVDSDKIRELVVGKVGTKRKIDILRNNKKISFNVVLKEIESSVNYQMINNKGYLNIAEFTKTTAKEVENALKYFESRKVKKIIIDLRDNPGGYLTTLEEVADLFLPSDKIILSTKDKSKNVQHYKTIDDKQYKNNYVILVNGNSASASEALTACLNENLNIEIYGQTTFGKGIMQNYFEYDDGGYLKYTNAEWLTPKGNSINQKGIKPTTSINESNIFKAMEYEYSFEKNIKNDSVSKELISYQKALKALGYNIDRVDGYYSNKTKQVINSFKNKYNLKNEKDLSIKVQSKIVERVFVEKNKLSNDNVLKVVLK